jgi:hypothetical protein
MGGATATHHGAGERREFKRRMRFIRDLWINFLANVMTASLLYLLGRATGFIKGSPVLMR